MEFSDEKFYVECLNGVITDSSINTLSNSILTHGIGIAYKYGHMDIVKRIIMLCKARGPGQSMPNIPECNFEDNIDMLHYMIEHGMPASGITPYYVCENDYIETYKVLQTTDSRAVSWKYACDANSFRIIQYMIQNYPTECGAYMLNDCMVVALLNSDTSVAHFNKIRLWHAPYDHNDLFRPAKIMRQGYHSALRDYMPDVLATLVVEYIPYR
jgi:hypothetical protein